ncbi:MAG: 16S rRNA (cytidine(1402)-2'-O)-methyltransferase, partial [Thermoleophilia bacterium]|nr:16S rRNA (cytidine(1402)-2'-O)-methyltransferase [Thermoleophilia bacterium]
PPKGEITIVIGARTGDPLEGDGSDAALRAVAELVAAGTPRRTAAEVVADLTGASKNALYKGSL